MMDKGSDQERVLKKYFGQDAFSSRDQIISGFDYILTEWRGDPTTIECAKECTEKPDQVVFGETKTGFYLGGPTYIPKGKVRICPPAWGLTDEQLAAVLVHELSHRRDWARGDEYCGMFENRGCLGIGTSDAIGNADSYAQFARECLNFMGRGIWAHSGLSGYGATGL